MNELTIELKHTDRYNIILILSIDHTISKGFCIDNYVVYYSTSIRP